MPKQYKIFRNGKIEKIDGHLPAETPVSLTVNGEIWLTFMCTPTRLETLAIGFLFNEGIIQDFSEVADTRLCKDGDNVDVWLYHAAEKPKKWTRTSGCTGGMTSVDTKVETKRGARSKNVMLSPEQISALLKRLDEHQILYRQSGGLHTSILTDGAEKTISAEDIGRHNTLDKLAGIALVENIAFKKRILLTTGRISSEMMQKAAKIKAEVVISRTSPSSLAVEIAEEEEITLIGYAKGHRFNLYTHAERIAYP